MEKITLKIQNNQNKKLRIALSQAYYNRASQLANHLGIEVDVSLFDGFVNSDRYKISGHEEFEKLLSEINSGLHLVKFEDLTLVTDNNTGFQSRLNVYTISPFTGWIKYYSFSAFKYFNKHQAINDRVDIPLNMSMAPEDAYILWVPRKTTVWLTFRLNRIPQTIFNNN